MTSQQRKPQTRLIPVAQFDKFYPWPSPGSLRNRIHSATRGNDPDFLKCIRRVGGRVLVDEQKFLEWADSQNDSEGE